MNEKRFVGLLWIAKAALLAVLVYAGFEVATSRLHLGNMLDPDTASGEYQTTDEQATLPQSREFSDYMAIIQRDLFMEADSTDSAQAGANRSSALEPMPSAEELGLRLVGAIAGGPVASRAIIQDTKTSATGSYRIGDTVASATVDVIERETVILRHQGRPLVLKLCAGTTADNPSNASVRNEKSDLRKTGRHGTEDLTSGGGTNAQTPPPNRAGHVAEVFRKATIEPYVRNSQTVGLKITGLDKIPMAKVFGLKNGDVVQTVNGQQLTSKQKAFQVLMKAKTQPRVDMQLLRDGKSKDLSFDL